MVTELEKNFVNACKKYHGKLDKSHSLLECDLSKKGKMHLLLGLNLMREEKDLADMKIVAGISNTELSYVADIKTELDSIILIGKDKTVAIIHPKNGVVTFRTHDGHLKGEMVSIPLPINVIKRRK